MPGRGALGALCLCFSIYSRRKRSTSALAARLGLKRYDHWHCAGHPPKQARTSSNAATRAFELVEGGGNQAHVGRARVRASAARAAAGSSAGGGGGSWVVEVGSEKGHGTDGHQVIVLHPVSAWLVGIEPRLRLDRGRASVRCVMAAAVCGHGG